MALFSRKKSKAKKASKEAEKQAAADAKATATPVKTPQRGRNGKILPPAQTSSEHDVHDIPVPSQPPRHFHTPSYGTHRSEPGRSHDFEESGEKPSANGKHDYQDPYSSGDSGYASAGPDSRIHSRTPSTNQLRDHFPMVSKSTPQLTLGDDFARGPAFSEHPFMDGDAVDRNEAHRRFGDMVADSRALKPSKSLQAMRKHGKSDQELGSQRGLPPQQQSHQDARFQRQIQQSMPMRPSSVPPQALQARHERVSRPPPQRSSSPGPILQNAYAAHSPRSRASVPFGTRPNHDWNGPQLQSSPFQPRLPTSPTGHSAHEDFGQDDFSPSLNILNGLKVNKRGLILDEEGDPIGELYEGDIIDCVRQKADAYGDVLDEYERIVGRVRTLSGGPSEPILRPFTPKPNNEENYERAPQVPSIPAEYTPEESREPHREHPVPLQQQQPMRTSRPQSERGDGLASPSRAMSGSHRRGPAEQENYLTMRPPQCPQDQGMPPHQQNSEHAVDQQDSHMPRFPVPASSIRRSESLPSVPESHSTAEVALSDDGSTSSERSQQPMIEEEPPITYEEPVTHEQVYNRPGHAKKVQQSIVQQSEVSSDAGEEGTDNAAMSKTQQDTESEGNTNPPRSTSMPSLHRSVSERENSSHTVPAVPAVPKSFLEPKKPNLLPNSGTLAHAQPIGLLATPNRVKSPPLPSFPGRGLSGSLPGGSPFASGPMPGMPARRLTTPGFSMPPSLGMAGLNAPPLKPRMSGTVPLVRSPLSSQGTIPTLFQERL